VIVDPHKWLATGVGCAATYVRTTRSIPSSTVVGGHLAIRPCFINPHTRLADVDALVDHLITIGDELTGVPSAQLARPSAGNGGDPQQ
jgi:hypothetical protein